MWIYGLNADRAAEAAAQAELNDNKLLLELVLPRILIFDLQPGDGRAATVEVKDEKTVAPFAVKMLHTAADFEAYHESQEARIRGLLGQGRRLRGIHEGAATNTDDEFDLLGASAAAAAVQSLSQGVTSLSKTGVDAVSNTLMNAGGSAAAAMSDPLATGGAVVNQTAALGGAVVDTTAELGGAAVQETLQCGEKLVESIKSGRLLWGVALAVTVVAVTGFFFIECSRYICPSNDFVCSLCVLVQG